MHELGVKRFFDVHGKMAIRLENVDGHAWPKRAAITVDELRDAIVSSVRREKAYDLDVVIRRIVKEVLEEEGVINKIIDGIHKAAEKNGFDCFDKEKEEKVMVVNSYDTDKYHTKEGLYFNCLDNGDVEIILKNEKTNKVVLDCDTWASVVASVCVKEKEEKVKTDNDLYIDYKGYYKCLPILIDFIKEQAQVGNNNAVNVLKRWDDNRPG